MSDTHVPLELASPFLCALRPHCSWPASSAATFAYFVMFFIRVFTLSHTVFGFIVIPSKTPVVSQGKYYDPRLQKRPRECLLASHCSRQRGLWEPALSTGILVDIFRDGGEQCQSFWKHAPAGVGRGGGEGKAWLLWKPSLKVLWSLDWMLFKPLCTFKRFPSTPTRHACFLWVTLIDYLWHGLFKFHFALCLSSFIPFPTVHPPHPSTNPMWQWVYAAQK